MLDIYEIHENYNVSKPKIKKDKIYFDVSYSTGTIFGRVWTLADEDCDLWHWEWYDENTRLKSKESSRKKQHTLKYAIDNLLGFDFLMFWSELIDDYNGMEETFVKERIFKRQNFVTGDSSGT